LCAPEGNACKALIGVFSIKRGHTSADAIDIGGVAVKKAKTPVKYCIIIPCFLGNREKEEKIKNAGKKYPFEMHDLEDYAK
jgi:hypothetical protein